MATHLPTRPARRPASPARLTASPAQPAAASSRFQAEALRWRGLYRIGGVAALAVVALMLVQVIVYVISPPPADGTAAAWFERFADNSLDALLAMDLLLMVDYTLLSLVYLALFVALRRTSAVPIAIGTVFALLGTAIYFAANPAFEMRTLSDGYATATTDAERASFLAAGEAMLATWEGTAATVSYVFGGIAMLLIGWAMLRGGVFGTRTAYVGLVTGALSVVPPSFGVVGFVLSFLSLLPLAVWLALVGRRLLWLADPGASPDDGGEPVAV